MFRALVIPMLAGLVCLVVTAVVLNLTMPLIEIDNAIKGLIKMVVWIVAFTGPAEYLRKKAKAKQAAE